MVYLLSPGVIDAIRTPAAAEQDVFEGGGEDVAFGALPAVLTAFGAGGRGCRWTGSEWLG